MRYSSKTVQLWIVIILAFSLAAGCRSSLGGQNSTATGTTPISTRTAILASAAATDPAPTSTPAPIPTATITPTPVPPLENSVVEVPAPSLDNNLLGDSTVQPVRVLLPPSYASGTKRYPVLYLLPGFGGSAIADEYFPPQIIARMMIEGQVKEMILVVINGENRLGGSFYVNSPVTGNWEDFVTRDVIRYIDEHYRTITEPEGRGITGHSMGGTGAFHLAMRHPEIYSATYAMSPGLFDEKGLADSHMFTPQNRIKAFLKARDALKDLSVEQAIKKMVKDEGSLGFTFAYGAAYVPNPQIGPPFFDYPYKMNNGSLEVDPVIWQRWEAGFGELSKKIKQYKTNLQKLNGIVIDYGRQDAFAWIPRGSDYLSQQLDAAGIPHELLSFEGTHNNLIEERILEHVLPFFTQQLADPELISNN